uniref:Uncharacterized protein n=1 Tax=Parascaris equorum TaxID=6256 RepID=A0A914RRH4_PAREQ
MATLECTQLAKMNGDVSVTDGMKVKLGPVLISGSRDRTIKFFDVNVGICLFSLPSFSKPLALLWREFRFPSDVTICCDVECGHEHQGVGVPLICEAIGLIEKQTV